MTDTNFSGSRIKPVQEKSKVAEVKMMQNILCMLCSENKEVFDKKNNQELEKNNQELEKYNINRQIIPLFLIAENKK